MFVPPEAMVVFESCHWRINQRVDARLPGYLMMAPRSADAVSFSTISPAALVEMGPILAKVTRAIEEQLQPRHLYVGRYGHMSGHNLHFHIIPVYDWLMKAFLNDTRYRVLRQFDTPGVYNSGQDTGFDGAEMTLFVWREFVEGRTSLPQECLNIRETIGHLRKVLQVLTGGT
jgi:diadenosine tetraphosphate (Ap4A) HIT family hydrolase